MIFTFNWAEGAFEKTSVTTPSSLNFWASWAETQATRARDRNIFMLERSDDHWVVTHLWAGGDYQIFSLFCGLTSDKWVHWPLWPQHYYHQVYCEHWLSNSFKTKPDQMFTMGFHYESLLFHLNKKLTLNKCTFTKLHSCKHTYTDTGKNNHLITITIIHTTWPAQ